MFGKGVCPVKDFVKEYGKIAGAFAAAAFLLSFLVGLITGNPFGVVLLRALLLAVIFGGMGAGLRLVVKKYLPELAGDRAEENRAAMAGGDELGSKVDITLPEENPLGAAENRAGAYSDVEELESAVEPGSDASTVTAASQTPNMADAPAAEALQGNAAEDLGEELLPAADAERNAGEGPINGAGGEGVIEEAASASGRGAGGKGSSAHADDSRLDALPDISALEEAPGTNKGASKPRAARRAAAERPDDALRGAVSGQDPATLAKAIRTLLKRDEKG